MDDLWSGYARTALLTQRQRERDECVYHARDTAMEAAERAARSEMRVAHAERYPNGKLAPSTMPLPADELQVVTEFWRDTSHVQALRYFDLGESDYPAENDWRAEVVARDMMRDIQALQVVRQRARATADPSECHLRPETREDIEAMFDSMMWRLFTAGDSCARMYIGFGNAEVTRLLNRLRL